MRSSRSYRAARRRAFTLVEMLVVLAILVLLVGMVAPRVLKSQKKADVNNTKAQIGMFRSCLERYAVDMKTFPSSEDGLTALVSPPDDAEGSSSTNWDGPYINQDSVPKDPWGNPFQYEYPPTNGKGDYPDIWSLGPDGEEDTEDDIVSWNDSDDEEGEGFEDDSAFEDEI